VLFPRLAFAQAGSENNGTIRQRPAALGRCGGLAYDLPTTFDTGFDTGIFGREFPVGSFRSRVFDFGD
jgi:hypothetical protein